MDDELDRKQADRTYFCQCTDRYLTEPCPVCTPSLLTNLCPIPDPSWAYAAIWKYCAEISAEHEQLRLFLAAQEDVSPQATEQLRQHFQSIQMLCIRAAGLLGEEA